MHKFEQLVLSIKQLIQNNTWPADYKLPSLRSQSQRSGLSLMTVLNAYQELEAQGLIYAKDKSGFYVAKLKASDVLIPPDAPDHSPISSSPSLFYTHVKAIQHLAQPSFAAAYPDEQLLNSIKLSKIIAEHAKRHYRANLKQHMPPGHLQLRQLIASHYQLQGIAATAEDIVMTSGALEALNLSLQALTQAGDYIVLQRYSYYAAWQAAERLGLKVISIAEHPQHGIDLDALAAALQHYPIKVCWLMLNSHEPIGFSLSDESKRKLAALLLQYQVYLIEDDSNQELYFGGAKPLPMNYFLPPQQVLHCASFSKTLGPSVRLGWVYAGRFSQHIQQLQLMSSFLVNPLLQSAMAEYVASHHYEKHLHQLRLILSQRKQHYYQLLQQQLQGYALHYHASGYFLWLQLPAHIDALQLYQDLLAQQIAVAPSALFCREPEPVQYLWLNCSAEISDWSTLAIHQLAQHIRRYPLPSAT
jgi:DNA-binding transcriptional MocR family regulator